MLETDQTLQPEPNDPTHSRMIDPTDRSVQPIEDTGYRFKPRFPRRDCSLGNASLGMPGGAYSV